MRFGWTRPVLRALAGALILALGVSGAPALAWDNHHHHNSGGDVFLRFSLPFGYYGPDPYGDGYAYDYPPAYAYPPDYDGAEEAYSAYEEPAPARGYDESYCREFQSTIIVNGRPAPAYGIACLQPDGSWRIVR